MLAILQEDNEVAFCHLSDDYLQQTIECVAQVFCTREILTKAVGISATEFTPFASYMCQAAINAKAALIAIDKKKDRVIGFSLGKSYTDITEMPALPLLADIMDLLSQLGTLSEQAIANLASPTDVIEHAMIGISFNTPYTRLALLGKIDIQQIPSIAVILTDLHLQTVKLLDYKLSIDLASNQDAQHICRQFNYQLLDKICYQNFVSRNTDEQPFKNLPGSCALFAKIL